MTRRDPAPAQLAGISLIEVMIAMVLGLLLLAGIYRVYLTTLRTSVTTESVAARQETIRYVSEILSSDARMAGYRGCLGDTGEVRNTLNPDPAAASSGRTEFSHADFLYRHDRYTEGFDAVGTGWSPALPTVLTGIVAGTDVLSLRAVLGTEAYVVQEMPNTSADLKTSVPASGPFASGDIVMITDCSGSAIFQITQYNAGNIVHNTGKGAGLPSPGNWTKDLGRRYPVGSQLQRIGTVSYSIRASASGNGPALWRALDGVQQEIAEGVENLQVLYGDDSNGDRVPDTYRQASAFTSSADWRRVVAVRVALLVVGSPRRAGLDDPRRFDLLGVSVGPFADGRLRRVVTLTLALRNRLP